MITKLKSGLAFVVLMGVGLFISGCESFVNDLRDIDPEEASRVEMLFVQTAQSGTFRPIGIDQSPRYRVEFKGVAPITSYFSDKPIRLAGSMTTPEFMALDKFTQHPTHAAIVLMDHNNSNEDVIMGILSNASYDAHAQTLGYDIFLLSSPPTSNLNRWPGMIDMQLARNFGRVSIFIEDESGCAVLETDACRNAPF